ncbi:hypothetical protein SAY87_007770 [Trapa incisa]|uniref:HTH La-type RNA-binding domain-containing protein n=1 Tax=Trapa incisa TaxID=236973 RepID=A0AAN7QFY6_9MYRT|nr:hypothetical protein SAY87_007770 [Trapa incisa]
MSQDSGTLDSSDRYCSPSSDDALVLTPTSSEPSPSQSSSSSQLSAQAPEFSPSQTPRTATSPRSAPGLLRVPFQHLIVDQNQFYHHHNHNRQDPHYYHRKQHQDQSEHDLTAQTKNGLSDDIIQRILNQVEYYFSDINLATTDHLMRFINRDPEGYVPISVVASFHKIKALISSYSKLVSVLRNSSKFWAIRTCKPQTMNGGGALVSRSSKLHAFVEYESVELAEKAVKDLNGEGDWRSGLRVCLLHRCGSKNVQAWGKKGHNGEHAEEHDALAPKQQLSEKPLDHSI